MTSDEQLQIEFAKMLNKDKELRAALTESIRRKKRGFIGNLISDLSKFLFGSVVQSLVDRTIDKIISWFSE